MEITPEELARKIVDNYTTAKKSVLQILSLQQGLEVRAHMVAAVEELELIEWPDLA